MTTSSKKVAIVTGASSGIGKATVLRLLEGGYLVYAGARRLEAMRDLEEQGAFLHSLDLTKPESIEAFVGKVLKESGRVDVLVNNAGYGAYGSVEETPLSSAREQFEVNLFGLGHITQLVIPAMRSQGGGKIVNVSSIGGKVWSPMGTWYQASKFALEGFSDCLRIELKSFGIDVVVIQPGKIDTEWADIATKHMLEVSGAGPYKEIAEAAAKFQGKKDMAGKPSEISDLIWTAVSVKRPRTRYAAPFHARVILFLRWLLSDSLYDWLFMRIFGLPTSRGASSKLKDA